MWWQRKDRYKVRGKTGTKSEERQVQSQKKDRYKVRGKTDTKSEERQIQSQNEHLIRF